MASKNKEIHLISPSDIKEFLLKNIKASKSNVKIDFLDLDENDCLLLVCSDKKMMLGFFKDDGVYDQNRLLTSTNDECIEWANELFNNFNRIVKENGVVLYNFSYSIENPSLPYKLVAEIVDQSEWCVADTIMWKKDCGLPFPANERRLSRNWEFVWIFVRKSHRNGIL